VSTGLYHHHHEPGAPGAPLIFLFHGTGGDETQLLGFARQLLPGAHLVAPRGDVSEQGANRFFRRTSEGVYDMADLGRATEKMVAFVRAHREESAAPEVLGLGYSNGANILASVLFTAPGLFDAAVLMHPLIPFTPPPQPGLAGRRVLITAGRRDPICPPPATEALAAWFEAQGARTEVFWHAGGHEIAQPELAAVAEYLSRG
jgi:phospholipase/carboxylesterase